MSVSSEADPEAGQGSVWVAGVAAQGSGEIDRPGAAEHADGRVAQGRHHAWAAAGAEWRVGVLEGLGVGELGQDGWDRG
jgi:hypothetical protein